MVEQLLRPQASVGGRFITLQPSSWLVSVSRPIYINQHHIINTYLLYHFPIHQRARLL